MEEQWRGSPKIQHCSCLCSQTKFCLASARFRGVHPCLVVIGCSLFLFRRPSELLPVAAPASRRQASRLFFCPILSSRRQDRDTVKHSQPSCLFWPSVNTINMLRQVPLRAAAAAPKLVVSATISRPFPFQTTRFLSTESAATTQAANSPSQPQEAAPSPRQLTYLVERTASNNISVYNDKRSGGTRKETTIKKVVGNAQHLKRDLIDELKFKKDDVNVNPVTGHVKIKVRRNRLVLCYNLICNFGHFADSSVGLPLGPSQDLVRSSRFLDGKEGRRIYALLGHMRPVTAFDAQAESEGETYRTRRFLASQE